MELRGPNHESDLIRFERLVDRSGGPDACHPWSPTRKNSHRYGFFKIGGTNVMAHRWWLMQCLGRELRQDELSLHTCDNPPCCNGAHLYPGDQYQNMQDALVRGRRDHVHDWSRSKTHCKRGHEFTPENTYIVPGTGRRSCKTCRLALVLARARRARGEDPTEGPICDLCGGGPYSGAKGLAKHHGHCDLWLDRRRRGLASGEIKRDKSDWQREYSAKKKEQQR